MSGIGSDDIVERGKATQFGQPGGADPVEAGKISAMPRDALRWFGAQEIDADPENAQSEIKRLLASEKRRPGRTNLTAMAAARFFSRIIEKPTGANFNTLCENIEGKLPQSFTGAGGQALIPNQAITVQLVKANETVSDT